MGNSKIDYFGQNLIDLTSDTVSTSTLLSGQTAHDKAGNVITGALVVNHIYVSTSQPSSSIGEDGDLWIVTG